MSGTLSRTKREKCPVFDDPQSGREGVVMAKKALDRRVPRTRALLQHALHSLLRKKDYETITIKDICAAANVGRSTFYVHYTSKDDLKRRGFEPLRRQLAERQQEALRTARDVRSRSLAFSLTMFEHARDHRDHYRALVGGRGGSVSLGSRAFYFAPCSIGEPASFGPGALGPRALFFSGMAQLLYAEK